MSSRRRRRAAFLAVAVGAARPDGGHPRRQRLPAIGKGVPQRVAVAREQAGVETSVGGHPRAMAIAAERRGHRTDQADFAGAVDIGMAAGDFAAISGVERAQRPAR